jgi:hypothetical protein
MPQWRLAPVILLLLLATGCASGARPGAMTAPLDQTHIGNQDSPYREATSVNAVTGGSKTNPLWVSEVSDADFKAALIQSLKLNALLADKAAKYAIDVTLVDLD